MAVNAAICHEMGVGRPASGELVQSHYGVKIDVRLFRVEQKPALGLALA